MLLCLHPSAIVIAYCGLCLKPDAANCTAFLLPAVSFCEKTDAMMRNQHKNNDNAQDIAIVIPARRAATRLPDKPLADIAGKPLIQHVWERAMEADLGPVIVAVDDAEIADVIQQAGGIAILTDSALPSGSDRIAAALAEYDPNQKYQHLINLQGDLPDLDPRAISVLADLLKTGRYALTTLVAPATPEEVQRSQVVKAAIAWHETALCGTATGDALYFSRAAIPHGETTKWHHIGLYGWQRDALTRFVGLPPSPLEISEKLEQLRALEAAMPIGVGMLDSAPGGVDTPEDLEAARIRMAKPSGE